MGILFVVANGKNISDGSDPGVAHKLSDDVRALFEPPVGVPPEVDRAVLDRAYAHLRQAPAERRRRKLHRVWSWRVAAAAAVVILAFSLDLTRKPEPAQDRLAVTQAQAVDIDKNGRVDILDAFKLARQIESSRPTEKAWDVNGDGRVDRHDVDVVAFAAVRLDKGVL